jgi:S1-C subfamily serine protease
VQDITPDIAQELGLEKAGGVVVAAVEPGSPASDAGIQPGDVIQGVNQKPVKNVDDFAAKIANAGKQDTVLLLIKRGRNNLFAALAQK